MNKFKKWIWDGANWSFKDNWIAYMTIVLIILPIIGTYLLGQILE
ncbi:hypothetical protein [Halobacteriovorax sp. YZS-1-1]